MDKDGEDLHEVMVKSIAWDEDKDATLVTLLEGFKHKFEDGDEIKFREVLGMDALEMGGASSANEVAGVTVKVLTPTQFTLKGLDARKYTPYQGNGIAKQVKVNYYTIV